MQCNAMQRRSKQCNTIRKQSRYVLLMLCVYIRVTYSSTGLIYLPLFYSTTLFYSTLFHFTVVPFLPAQRKKGKDGLSSVPPHFYHHLLHYSGSCALCFLDPLTCHQTPNQTPSPTSLFFLSDHSNLSRSTQITRETPTTELS